MKKYKIAVLGDYQNVALESSDWSVLRDRTPYDQFLDFTFGCLLKRVKTSSTPRSGSKNKH
jgi:hypothetical protein